MLSTTINNLTYSQIENLLSNIFDDIEKREAEFINEAGSYNTNSRLTGLCNGSLSVKTKEEVELIHQLKQALMSKTAEVMNAARQRNIERRKARKAERNATA